LFIEWVGVVKKKERVLGERRARSEEGAKRGGEGEGVEEATENINLVKNTPNNLVFKKISCNFGWK
jgi:hypothetical protein